jgi:hypothetical protein
VQCAVFNYSVGYVKKWKSTYKKQNADASNSALAAA